MADRVFEGGAVRSSDGDHLEFVSLPWLGVLAVARTAGEGMPKYGRWNYAQGMDAATCWNRACRHIAMHILGDRSEPHACHAGWNVLAAIQSELLHPELNARDQLGPGATITPELRAFLEAGAAERARRRASGEFADLSRWRLADLPEVRGLLAQRAAALAAAGRPGGGGEPFETANIGKVPDETNRDSMAARLREFRRDIRSAPEAALRDAAGHYGGAMTYLGQERDWPDSDTPFAEDSADVRGPGRPAYNHRCYVGEFGEPVFA